MIFFARATRGRGLPSLDARSRRSFSPHLEETVSKQQPLKDMKGAAKPSFLLAERAR